jgi:hypothetical protein
MKLIIFIGLIFLITLTKCYSTKKYMMRKAHLKNKSRTNIIAEILENSDDEI